MTTSTARLSRISDTQPTPTEVTTPQSRPTAQRRARRSPIRRLTRRRPGSAARKVPLGRLAVPLLGPNGAPLWFESDRPREHPADSCLDSQAFDRWV